MLTITRINRISAHWTPHAEQLKQWIATSGGDVAKLGAARLYATELPWQSVLKDLEDCSEAVLLLYKAGFDKRNHVFDAIRHEVAANSQKMTVDLIRTSFLAQDQDAELFRTMASVLLTPKQQLSLFKANFSLLSPTEKVAFAKLFWRSTRPHKEEESTEYWGLNSIICASLVKTVSPKSKSFFATLLDLAGSGVPDSDTDGVFLMEHLIQESAALSPYEKLELMEVLARQHRDTVSSSRWFCALRSGYVADHSNYLSFSSLLNTAKLSPTYDEAQRTQEALRLCEKTHMVDFCESLAKSTNSSNVMWTECRRTVRHRALKLFSSDKSSIADKTAAVLCLAAVNAPEAHPAAESIVKETNNCHLPHESVSWLLRALVEMAYFPHEYVQQCVTEETVRQLREEDCVYLLYMAIRVNVAVPPLLAKRAAGQAAGRQFSRKKKSNLGSSSTVKPVSQVYRIASTSCLTLEAHGINGEQLATELIEQGALDFSLLELLLTSLCELKAPLPPRRVAVAKAVHEVNESSTIDFIHLVLRSMGACAYRNAAGFEKVIACLRSSGKPIKAEVLLCVAVTAQKLHLLPQFERSGLLESTLNLDLWSAGDVSALANALTAKQRQWLMSVPGAKGKLIASNATGTRALDSVVFFNMVADAEKANVLEHLTGQRTSAAGTHVSAEDAVTALENVVRVDPSQFDALFRLVSSAFEKINEQQMMRVLRCLSLLPSCPNHAFRTLGKSLIRLSPSMSANNAVLWLSFYAGNRVRDDSVAKSLVRKANSKHATLSRSAVEQLLRGAEFYGQTVKLHPGVKNRRGVK